MTKRDWLTVYEYTMDLDLRRAERDDPEKADQLRKCLRSIKHALTNLSDDELDKEI